MTDDQKVLALLELPYELTAFRFTDLSAHRKDARLSTLLGSYVESAGDHISDSSNCGSLVRLAFFYLLP
jgi:hypothetical protein